MDNYKLFWNIVKYNCNHLFEPFVKPKGPIINRECPDNEEIVCKKCFIAYGLWKESVALNKKINEDI